MIGFEHAFSLILSGLSYLAPFVGVLIFVVFAHEFGHFAIGRMCGAKVDVFSIGMGPELVGFSDRFGTRWRLSALPIGGYVRFAASPPFPREVGEASPPSIHRAESGRALAQLSTGKRAAIIAAGPAASILTAILVLSGLAYFAGQTFVPARVGAVAADSPAARAGLEKGDVITRIDDRAIATFPEMFDYVSVRPGEPMTIHLVRAGQEMSVVATPALAIVPSPIGAQRVGRLGLVSADDITTARTIYPDLAGAFGMGLGRCWAAVSMTEAYLVRLVTGHATTDQLSGPIRIAQVANFAASVGIAPLVQLAGLLSLSLGLMNLLPVPMLDGGQLIYCAIEAILRRPMSRRAQEYGLRLGAAMMLGLTFFVTFNDLRRMITG